MSRPLCAVPACLATVRSRTLCSIHYDRALRWLGAERHGRRQPDDWADAIAVQTGAQTAPVVTDEAALAEAQASRAALADLLGKSQLTLSDAVSEVETLLHAIDGALAAGGHGHGLDGVRSALTRLTHLEDKLAASQCDVGIAEVIPAVADEKQARDIIRPLLPSGWSLGRTGLEDVWTIRDNCGQSRGSGDSPQTAAKALIAGLVAGDWLPLAVQLNVEELAKIEEIIRLHDGGPVVRPDGAAECIERLLRRPEERMRVRLTGHRDLGIIRARRTPAGGLVTDDGTLYGPCAVYSAELVGPAPEPKIGLEVELDGRRVRVAGFCPTGVMLLGGSWVSWARWTADAVAVTGPAAPAPDPVPVPVASIDTDDIPF